MKTAMDNKIYKYGYTPINLFHKSKQQAEFGLQGPAVDQFFKLHIRTPFVITLVECY